MDRRKIMSVLAAIGLFSLIIGSTHPLARSLAAEGTSEPTLPATEALTGHANRTVFLIMMENHNWPEIKGNRSAPYINDTLLPLGAHAEQYYNPPRLHSSEPNYLWLEAGTNFNVANDLDPKVNHQASTQHLVTLLNAAGVTWKAYQEGIDGRSCPLVSKGLYAAKHNPMVFFDDVTDRNNPNSAYCIAHERPYSELASDLANNAVARYNFITPDLCDDMHNSFGCQTPNSVGNGDTWLANEVPKLLASSAYRDGGVIMITWDEAEDGDGPIGFILLSPNAKAGYSNNIHYTHSSTLRTLQEIFDVSPWLGDAAQATDLSDLFTQFP